MEIVEAKKILTLSDEETRKLDEAYLVLSDIWGELREECNDTIVGGELYECLQVRYAMSMIDAIADASEIKVLKGE